jgi:endoglucanase
MIRNTLKKLLFTVVLGSAFVISAQGQFLKASGKKIIDDSNKEVILRGMGLGGWMIQEGYMLETNGFANPQREIKAQIESLIGSANTDAFYEAWLTNLCTRKDIDSLASWGFNSVRLPMHYNLFTLPIQDEPVQGANTWLTKGFALTDSLIKWCSANHIYVILDLHGAPGGQGHDAAISDYDPSKPSLWESDLNKSKTVELWKKLAQRYVNEPWVGGYDLINEPNWNFTAGANANGCSETAASNKPLWDLYKSITTAIRAIDQKHIIFVEGNCWANNHAGFSVFDNNLVVSFHKYWSNNDVGTIQGYINISNANNVPLWLGEAGENSNQWFKDAIELSENNNIGWSWWPLKKVSSVVGPLTIKKNTDYATLLAYWGDNTGTKPKPTQSFATNALMQLTEDIKIQNCTYHKDVIDAMFRQINTTSTIPYNKINVPDVVQISDFDMGSNGYAYQDKDIANYQVSTQVYTAWNNGWAYRNDGVDIEATQDTDARSNGYDVGWTETGEWMQYTLSVDSSAAYKIEVRYAALNAGSKLKLSVNEGDVTQPLSLAATGGYQTWGTATFNDVVLSKGQQHIRLHIENAGMNLGFMVFSLSKKSSEVAFHSISAETYQTSENILVSFNKPFNGATLNAAEFSSTVNGVNATIKSIAVHTDNNYQLMIALDQPILDGDVIKISYTGTDVKSLDASSLDAFANLLVENSLPKHLAIPGKIEAENYSVNNGLSSEACTDISAGLDMGHTDVGDYLDFDVRIAKTALYTISVRSASNSTAGSIAIQQLGASNQILNQVSVTIPVTGGWQTWTTVKANINLTEGISKIRVKVTKTEFNLNWFDFAEAFISGTKDNRQGNLLMYPNPVKNYLNIEMPDNTVGKKKMIKISSVSGVTIKELELNSTNESQPVFVGDISRGLYVVEVQTPGNIWRNKIIIE